MPNPMEEAMGREAGMQPAAPMPGQALPADPAAVPVDDNAATPEDQAAYDSAMEMASEILHGNEKASDGIIKSMQEDGQEGAIESIAGTVKLVLNKIEDQMQGALPETVILSVAEKTAELAMELGEESGAFVLEPQQVDQAKGAVVRDLVETYGMDEADMAQLQQGMSEDDMATATQAFGGM